MRIWCFCARFFPPPGGYGCPKLARWGLFCQFTLRRICFPKGNSANEHCISSYFGRAEFCTKPSHFSGLFYFCALCTPGNARARQAVAWLNVTPPINVMNSSQSYLISPSSTTLSEAQPPPPPALAGGDRNPSSCSHPPLISRFFSSFRADYLSIYLSVKGLFSLSVCQCLDELSLLASPNRFAHLWSCLISR